MPEKRELATAAMRLIGQILLSVVYARAATAEEMQPVAAGATSVPVLTIVGTSPSIVDRYSHSPDNLVEAVGGGANISFMGLPGHLPGDSERTAVEIRTRSRAGSDVEETALDVEMKDDSGLTYLWLPARSYPAGAYVANSKNIYQTAKACRSSSSGGGPSDKKDQRDGTCIWTYQHADNDGKSASLLSGVITPKGGKLWGQAIDVIAEKGSMGSDSGLPGGPMIGQEIDTGLFAKKCPVTPSDCLVVGEFLAGFSKFPGTAGILGGGQPERYPLYDQGITLLPHFASSVAFNDATSADVGFQSNGRHKNFTFQDNSESPTAIDIGGKHEFAGVFDNKSQVAFYSSGTHGGGAFKDDSTSPISIQIDGRHPLGGYVDRSASAIAVDLSGSHETGIELSRGKFEKDQLSGTGFSVDPLGNIITRTIKITPVTVASLPACDPKMEGTFAGVIDAASPTYNGVLRGGGSTHIPVYCDGKGWTAH